jgi:acetate kinase
MASVLTLNGGSSSIRFAVFEAGPGPAAGKEGVGGRAEVKLIGGKIERIGSDRPALTLDHVGPQGTPPSPALGGGGHGSAAEALLDWLASQPVFASVAAVGHRVVYGMQHANPERVTPRLLAELQRFTVYDPEHLPREIEMMESVARRLPALPQVACFDTAFHRSMPRVATLLPIPRRYAALGLQRYGFHGLSYTFLMAELGRLADPAAAHGRVVLAHLGNGASLAAVRDGSCIDTSMGFTPASGIPMGTRSGDLDPGVVSFLAQAEGMDAAGFQRMVTHQSGLLGISETSADVRDLLEREREDARAAEAIALFCYQAKKWLGGFAAALGGIDTLVFAGGIGENSPVVRARICDGLGFLGIVLDPERNANNAGVVSADASTVRVRVIHTDEEAVIASATRSVIGSNGNAGVHS